MLQGVIVALALVATMAPPATAVAAAPIVENFRLSLSPLKVREGSEVPLTLSVDLVREKAAKVDLTLTLWVDEERSTATRGVDYQLPDWGTATSTSFVMPAGRATSTFEFLFRASSDSSNGRRKTVVFTGGWEPNYLSYKPQEFPGNTYFYGIWSLSLSTVTIVPAGFCGRTPQVLDAILNALPTVDDCLVVTTSTLATLDDEELSLFWEGIRELEADDFAGLVNLRRLEMNFNPIDTLPAGLFDDLASLEYLHLSDNELTTLPAGLFDRLTRLEQLSLHGNELTTLPAGLFDRLTRLEQLSLQDNALATLPAGLFDSLTRLEWLDLARNELTTVPTGLFNGLTRLAWLRLSGNALGALPADVFDGLAGLEELWLDDNRISSLPDFASSTSLTTLELGSNQLASVPANAFRELTALTALHLDRNLIATLHNDAFSGLGNLTELWLSYNRLESLPAEVFDPLTALETLELHSNEFAELPAGAFDSLTGLTGLWLHDNRIGNPPAGLFHPLTSLTTLNLRDNRIERLPVDTFLGLDNLEYLWLTGNPGVPFNGLLMEVEDTTGGDIEIVESQEEDSFTLSVGSGEVEGLRLTIPKAVGIIRKVTLATLASAPGGAEGEPIRQEIRAAMSAESPAMARPASSSQEIFHVDVQGSAPGPLAAPVTLCLPYAGDSGNAGEIPSVYRYADGRWRLLAGRTSASEGVVCGATARFSAFAVFLRTPSLDVNEDDIIDEADALILYYAFVLRSELGNGR